MSRDTLSSPMLQVVGGTSAGRLFKLTVDPTIIGRALSCDLILDPRTVSRRHAEISMRDGVYRIRDLESTRGTFLDGHRVTESTPLRDDSRIQIGEVTLRFLVNSADMRDPVTDQTTVYATVADLLAASNAGGSEAMLRALRQISRDFGGELDLNSLLAHVLDAMFDLFPQASVGFVELGESEEESAIEVMKSRSGEVEGLAVSTAVHDRVTREGRTVLGRDVRGDPAAMLGVVEGPVGSLMCVPVLNATRRPVGVVRLHADAKRGPFTEEDLDLLASVAGQIGVSVQNVRMHRDLLRQRELERELEAARRVLRALLPERPNFVEGYEFWDRYEPARQVGGDYYGIIPLFDAADAPRRSPRRWAVAVGDVVGKGLPAALLTARLSAEVGLSLQDARDPVDVVSRLNRRMFEHGVLDMFVTFLLVMLDVEDHSIHVVNAGHPPPLLRRRDGTVEEIGSEAAGFPLAIDGAASYECHLARLEPGEFLVLHTDGVTDAMSASGDRFTDARLRELLARPHASPREAVESVFEAIRTHALGRPQFDDVTLVAFGRTSLDVPSWQL